MLARMEPTLIIHAGAGLRVSLARQTALRKKIRRILNNAYEKLCQESALQAVIEAVVLLEKDPAFNAGIGSMLQKDGKARLSASVMDGVRMRFAGVLNLEGIASPVLVAQSLLEEESRVLAGKQALNYARRLGFKVCETRTSGAIRRWKKRQAQGSDTVGACALDRFGRLASATSTGGRGFETPGRVSDSSMPIANYATGRAAVSATGVGEEIMEEGLAVRIVTRVEDGMSLRSAFAKTFAELRQRNRKMGAIGLDRSGQWFQATTTEMLSFGVQNRHQQILF